MNTLTYFNYWFDACLPELTRRSFASHVHEEGSSSYHSYYWQTTEKDRASQFKCLLNQTALIYCMYMYTVDS